MCIQHNASKVDGNFLSIDVLPTLHFDPTIVQNVIRLTSILEHITLLMETHFVHFLRQIFFKANMKCE